MLVSKHPPSYTPLLSTAAVAEWLGVSPRTVCLWAECKELPALKVGRQWRFREDELRRWLDEPQLETAQGNGIASAVLLLPRKGSGRKPQLRQLRHTR